MKNPILRVTSTMYLMWRAAGGFETASSTRTALAGHTWHSCLASQAKRDDCPRALDRDCSFTTNARHLDLCSPSSQRLASHESLGDYIPSLQSTSLVSGLQASSSLRLNGDLREVKHEHNFNISALDFSCRLSVAQQQISSSHSSLAARIRLGLV